MRTIHIVQPRRVSFGQGSAQQCVGDALALHLRRIFIVTSTSILPRVEPIARKDGHEPAVGPLG